MIDEVIKIVLEASKIMLCDDKFSVEEKDGATNIVTSNDVKVQEFLIDKLKQLLPESSFYCEENNIKDLSKDYIWIIDPIDGTTNYAHHIPITAISVALEYKGEIILGVVFNPYQNTLYQAEKNKGALLNGKPIHVTNHPFNKSVLYTAFSAYDKTKSPKIFDFLKTIFPEVNDIRRTGSAAFEISSIGAGRGDLFFELKLSTWDYAAASIIIQEAGGYISNLEGKIPLDGPSLIVAANTKENHLKLINLIKDIYCQSL